jgi:hypothetical protein
MEEWSSQRMQEVFTLVKAINDFVAAKKKNLPYNINVIDELHANENAHSRILRKLLQYKDSFYRYRILESLLHYISLLEGKEEFAKIEIQKPTITQEKERIDLWIRDKESGYAIILENKIKGAVDQDAQLARYIQSTRQSGFNEENIYVIYLPSDEHEPADYSWQYNNVDYKESFKDRYVNLSFKSHILPWLKEEILPNCIIKEELLISAIKQYIDHLEGLFWMRPSQKKLIMDKELLKRIGLNTDLSFAEQYHDFDKKLTELNAAKEMLNSYRQNEVDNLMKNFTQKTKKILGDDWEINDQISTGSTWYQIYNKHWEKSGSSIHLEWIQVSIRSLYVDCKYTLVLHLERGWNGKKDFVDALQTACSLIEAPNKKSATTFYSQTFDAKTPIAKMNDAELEDFLTKVYRSEEVTSIIEALNKELHSDNCALKMM